ncbi:GntR family transcriptional regulator [Corynebacterium sp. TAE3-ERU12]|uniref:GntR family transcriptional regulator n=1 Tax=Corynebacterium sp. TAE3-ERU12 TaxID=2849491 RepID=UPI001C451D94|nr:GntR family transcriptional regulator [Corynebacterium sp. TAE3-ERU12]MBV7295942.1 GntR family transcriptional regulator [Corynebacterium sp. TAE3-ERU12]
MIAAIAINTADPTPAFEQLRRQIADRITSGVLQVGDRLPSVRQLARDLDLAPGTVARAYKELDTAGLTVSRRGGGTRVAATATATPDPDRAARDYVAQALAAGDDLDRAIVRLRGVWPTQLPGD